MRGGPSEGSGNDNPFLEIRKNSWFLFNGGGGGRKKLKDLRYDADRILLFWLMADWKSGGFDPLYVPFYSTGFYSWSDVTFLLLSPFKYLFFKISPRWKKPDVLDPSLTWTLRASVTRLLTSVSQYINFRHCPCKFVISANSKFLEKLLKKLILT